jgi:SAM-dependent methyltransferase
MSEPVRDQYEAYPYPARDPKDEGKRLIAGSPSNLAEIDHYVFAGRADFAKPFRALIAGGGTGDAAIMMAQQLSDWARERGRPAPGEVVYLDLSGAAREIAEARAGARGLTNISFHSGSLLDLPELGLGVFDYIDCCGVLHHLEDPPAGLAALAEVLQAAGGMGIMVYAPLGRTGVYPAQAMLRGLGEGGRGEELPLDERVTIARRLIAALPATNWLKRNPFLGDHKRSDAGLVDLLLHSRDRAYRVEQVAALVAGAGLRLTGFIEPARYEPANYLKDPVLLKRLAGLDPLARAAFAEALAGNIKKHVFYVVKGSNRADTVARAETPAAVPVARQMPGPELARAIAKGSRIKTELDGLSLSFALPRLAAPILTRVDGHASLSEIHAGLQALDSSLDWDVFKAQFDQLHAVLNGLTPLLIRHPAAGCDPVSR